MTKGFNQALRILEEAPKNLKHVKQYVEFDRKGTRVVGNCAVGFIARKLGAKEKSVLLNAECMVNEKILPTWAFVTSKLGLTKEEIDAILVANDQAVEEKSHFTGAAKLAKKMLKNNQPIMRLRNMSDEDYNEQIEQARAVI